MTMNALRYDFVDDELQKSYEDMCKEHTNKDFRQKVLKQASNVLKHHTGYENVEFDEELVSTKLRRHELVGVMSALHALTNDLNNYREMTRFQHLKAAITGGAQ